MKKIRVSNIFEVRIPPLSGNDILHTHAIAHVYTHIYI